MNWDVIAAAGEIVGALAVVVSLVYVAYQVKQNTAALNVSTHQELVANQNTVLDLIAGDPQICALMVKADTEYENLTAAEQKQFMFLYVSIMNVFQCAYSNYKTGLLDQEIWESWKLGYKTVLGANPGIVREWHVWRDTFPPDFAKVVSDVTENQGANGT